MNTTYNFTTIKETEKALLISINGYSFEMWLPKSACTINGETIEVAAWKAREINQKIAAARRFARETEILRKEVERDFPTCLYATSEADRKAIDESCAFSHYDRRREEWYLIDKLTGKRIYA